MRMIRALIMGWLVLLAGAGLASRAGAEVLAALARLDPATSSLLATGGQDTAGGGFTLELRISQPVPWRVRMMDNPPRLILDAREVDWTGIERMRRDAPQVLDLRAGSFRAGWSRLVVGMDGPYRVAQAEMRTGQDGVAASTVRVRLEPVDAVTFRDIVVRPIPEEWSLPEAAAIPAPPARGEGPFVIVLDPGHGGIDPGAERDGAREADLMLTFARELKEHLLRDGRFKVVLTRDEDVFVPLEARISIARKAHAHVFISLHADALSEGEAQGTTIYTLSDDATDAAAQTLAERHERDDLLAGIDLTAQDDLVATVLMDMARTETVPRTARLADALEEAIKAAKLRMHRHPQQEAGFSVLKSPDIPSILLELGFLSSSRDLKRLSDPQWRSQMAEALRVGLLAWAAEDLSLRALRDN